MTTSTRGFAPVVRVGRPPLTKYQRRGAAIAGVVGFLLVNLGWVPFAVTATLFAVAILVFVFSELLGGTDHFPTTSHGISEAFAHSLGLRVAAVDAILIGSCVIGAAFIVAGIVVSIRVLKRHGLNHPVGITWASLALAIVVNWIIGGIVSFIFGAISNTAAASGHAMSTAIVAPIGIVGAIVVEAVIGWLLWWWMAHAMRHRIPAA